MFKSDHAPLDFSDLRVSTIRSVVMENVRARSIVSKTVHIHEGYNNDFECELDTVSLIPLYEDYEDHKAFASL